MPTEASLSGGAADGQGAEVRPVWGSVHRTGPPARPVQQHPQPLFRPEARLPHPCRGRAVPAWRSRFPAAHPGQGGGRGAAVPQCARSVPSLRVGGPAPTRAARGPPHATRPPLPARAVARRVTRPAVLPSGTEVPD